jgi:hypothetical protein
VLIPALCRRQIQPVTDWFHGSAKPARQQGEFPGLLSAVHRGSAAASSFLTRRASRKIVRASN